MDKESFSALYNASRKELYGYCRKLCGNSHDADDLMQQTYLKAWENFDKFDGRNLSSWLCSIARNTFLNNLRNVRNESLIDEYEEIPDNSTNPEFITEKKYIYGILLKALKNYLSPAQRMTVILYYYDEKSVSEISGIMHCPKGTVESRLCSAREKLRRELKKSGNIFTYLVFVSTVFRHKLKNIHIPVNARITVSAVVTAAAMVSVSMASIPPENKLPDTVITINETHTSENLTTTENKTVIQTSSETAFIATVSHATTNKVYITMPIEERQKTAFKSEYEEISETETEETTESTSEEEPTTKGSDNLQENTSEEETINEYEEVTTMKKEIISAVTAITTAFAGLTATTTTAENETPETYLEFSAMTDEEFSEYTQDRYDEYGFGDDSIADEIKFKNLLYVVPDFFIGDNYESEDYNIYKIFADGEATAYIPFYVDSETELDKTLSADFFGYPEDWTIQYIDGVGIFGDNIYERVHEYRICIPKEVILDFESYVRLYESRFEIYSNNEKYQKYGITGNTWIDCQFLPKGEELFFEPVNGDANLDGRVSISDSVAIIQYLANPEKYPLSPQAMANADIYNTGDGITGLDASYIQQLEATQS